MSKWDNSADNYNRDKLASGEFAIATVTRLVRLAQMCAGVEADGKFGPQTYRAVSKLATVARPAFELCAVARTQVGKPYVFGTENDGVKTPTAHDCSELVQWALAQLGLWCPDGSWKQYQYTQEHPVKPSIEEALATAGALLFYFEGDPTGDARPRRAHVAISLGTGYTVEARSRRAGVGIFEAAPAARHWTHAGYLPCLVYTPDPADLEEMVETLKRIRHQTLIAESRGSG
jgi:hypothetical protein